MREPNNGTQVFCDPMEAICCHGFMVCSMGEVQRIVCGGQNCNFSESNTVIYI